jgi:hypothetical protein
MCSARAKLAVENDDLCWSVRDKAIPAACMYITLGNG